MNPQVDIKLTSIEKKKIFSYFLKEIFNLNHLFIKHLSEKNGKNIYLTLTRSSL